MRRYIFTLLFSGIFCVTFGQRDTIVLRQSSFEQAPHKGGRVSTRVLGWFDCGRINFPNETAPDIHPNNYWENNVPPLDGFTYLGMVTRDNESWESISQQLSKTLQGGKCYRFSAHFAKSDKYLSGSSTSADRQKLFNYTKPIVVRIWGGKNHCDTRELLAESAPVAHKQWRKYDFKFEPTQELRYIIIEAFYKTPTLFPYNGHVLIDQLSPIIEVDCDIQKEIAERERSQNNDVVVNSEPNVNIKTSKPQKKQPKQKPSKTTTSKDTPSDAVATNSSKILKDLDHKKIRKGQKIKIENLYFEANKSTINEKSHRVLDEIQVFLAKNRNIKIEIGGHTNGTPSHEFCDNLSTDRAKAVAEYLINKGVPKNQITYKGYGKRKPIANNFTAEGRAKNQRVEIKILSIG